MDMDAQKQAVKAAFPHTIPVMTGYLFLGMAFGMLLQSRGYGVWWAFFMSLFIFAGSMQFVAVDMLSAAFNPFQAAMLTLMVNARHIFYSIAMLGRFQSLKKCRPYMIFALTDETFSLLCAAEPPDGVERASFDLSIAGLDHSYWITGSVIGSLAGAAVPFNMTGIDFVMAALFVVIFLDQWLSRGGRIPAAIGVLSAAACLVLFGPDAFMLPTMGLLVILLTLLRRPLEGREKQA